MHHVSHYADITINTIVSCACSVGVLNDFEANGYGVLALQPDDIVVLNDVPVNPTVWYRACASQQFSCVLPGFARQGMTECISLQYSIQWSLMSHIHRIFAMSSRSI